MVALYDDDTNDDQVDVAVAETEQQPQPQQVAWTPPQVDDWQPERPFVPPQVSDRQKDVAPKDSYEAGWKDVPEDDWEPYVPKQTAPKDDDWEPYKPPPEAESGLATLGREVAHGVLPAAGAAGAGMYGAGVGAVVGGPIGAVVGGLGAGFLGGYGTSALQEKGLEAAGVSDEAQRQANLREHPYWAAAGQGISNIAGFGRGAVEAGTRLLSGAISGGGEAASQMYQQGPSKFFSAEGLKEAAPPIIAQTGAGLLFPKPYQWGQRLEQAGARVGGRLRPESTAPAAPSAPAAPLEPMQGEFPMFGGRTQPQQAELPLQPPSAAPTGAVPRDPELPMGLPPVGEQGQLSLRGGESAGGRSSDYAQVTAPTYGRRAGDVRHGTPGALSAAGTAEMQPPAAGRRAGGHGPEDYGKDTAPAEGGGGVNVGQVDPTVAHAIEQAQPELPLPRGTPGALAQEIGNLERMPGSRPGVRPEEPAPTPVAPAEVPPRQPTRPTWSTENVRPPAPPEPPPITREQQLRQPYGPSMRLTGDTPRPPAAPPPTAGDLLKAKEADRRQAALASQLRKAGYNPEQIAAMTPVQADVALGRGPGGVAQITPALASQLRKRGYNPEHIAGMTAREAYDILAPRRQAAPEGPPQPLQRRVIERDATGRPIRTERLPVGNEQQILERGRERAPFRRFLSDERGGGRLPFGRGKGQPPSSPFEGMSEHELRDLGNFARTDAQRQAVTDELLRRQSMRLQGKGPAPAAARPIAGAARPATPTAARPAASSAGRPAAAPAPAARTATPAAGGIPPRQPSVSPQPPLPSGHTPVEAILSRIAAHPQSSWSDKIPRSIPEAKEALHQFYAYTLNAAHPFARWKNYVEQRLGKPLASDEDFHTAARHIKGIGGRYEHVIEHGTYDPATGKTTGPGLRPTIDKIEKDPDSYRAYAAAKRAITLEARGIKTGIPMKEANAVVAQLGAKWGPVHKEMVDFQGRVLDMLKDVVGAGNIAKMKAADPEYIPFYRLMDPDSELGRALGAGRHLRSPIHAIEGSERQILDPVESVLKNTMMFTDIAEKARVRTLLAQANNKLQPDLQFMKEKKNVRPMDVSASEINKHLATEGITEQVADGMKVFRRMKSLDDEQAISVFKDGKETVYDVPRDLGRAIQHLDPQAIHPLIRVLAIPARMLRAGTVLSPQFGARNVGRDQITAFIQSPLKGYYPFYDFFQALGDVLGKKNSKAYQDWLKNGGANSNVVSMDRQMFRLNPQTLAGRVQHGVRNPLEALQAASEIMENATRLGMYKRAITRGASPTEAVLASREGTVDFSRQGYGLIPRSLNAIIPFFNPNVQGTDRLIRAFRQDPVGSGLKAFASITVPSLLLWMHNKDDPRYAELPWWRKDAMWNYFTDHWVNVTEPNELAKLKQLSPAWKRQLPDGTWQRNDGTIYSFPKPFLEGVLFGSMPERIMDHYYKTNPNAFSHLGESLWNAALPNFIPQLLLPGYEAATNQSQFLQSQLMNEQIKRRSPSQQVTPYTSETAKKIAGAFGTVFGDKPMTGQLNSPIVVDNYIRQWTGGLGQYAVQGIDAGLKAGKDEPPKPTPQLADMPFVRGFVARFPQNSLRSVSDFYDMRAERQRISADIAGLKKTDPKRAEQMYRQGGYDPGNSFAKELSDMRTDVQRIMDDKKMSPDNKRAMIDIIQLRMADVAKKGLADFEKTKRKELVQ
jgi:hypothetical protein